MKLLTLSEPHRLPVTLTKHSDGALTIARPRAHVHLNAAEVAKLVAFAQGE